MKAPLRQSGAPALPPEEPSFFGEALAGAASGRGPANSLVNAPRELWDGSCNSNVASLTITPGNPDLMTCQ